MHIQCLLAGHSLYHTAGNAGGVFSVGSATGALTVAAALDFETSTSYLLTLQAADRLAASGALSCMLQLSFL